MRDMTPGEVTRVRAWVMWLGRAAAVACFIPGAYMVLQRLIFGITQQSLEVAIRSYREVGEGHSFSRGVALLLVGAAIGLFSRRLAEWIVAMPPSGCPRCGYEGFTATSDRCPECGLVGNGQIAKGQIDK